MRMDIRVYDSIRKYGRLPEYEASPSKNAVVYTDVPIFVISANELDAAIGLEDMKVIQNNCNRPLILTDRTRVLMVNPEGYGYVRYACVIDAETAKEILSRV